MNRTGISWTNWTWNLVRGCRQCSEGCEHCYAMDAAHRVNKANAARGLHQPYAGLVQLRGGKPKWTGKVKFVMKLLVAPLRKKQPLKIFVNSMSDLFYAPVSNEEIAAAFGVMAAATWHTFQILTKRAERMVAWFAWVQRTAVHRGMTPAQLCFDYARQIAAEEKSAMKVLKCASAIYATDDAAWPLPNVWVGISAEDQDNANVRIPLLLQVPVATRFVSAEPLLGPIDLTLWLKNIGWVIAGCESGDDRRPAEVDWFRSLRDQCAATGTSFFLKQVVKGEGVTLGPGSKKKQKGIVETPALDGQAWAEFPRTPPAPISTPGTLTPERSALNHQPTLANRTVRRRGGGT